MDNGPTDGTSTTTLLTQSTALTFDGPTSLTATVVGKDAAERKRELQDQYDTAAKLRQAYQRGEYTRARNDLSELIAHTMDGEGCSPRNPGPPVFWSTVTGGAACCFAGIIMRIPCLPVAALTLGGTAAGVVGGTQIYRKDRASANAKALKLVENTSPNIQFKVAEKQLECFIREEQAAANEITQFLNERIKCLDRDQGVAQN